MLYCKVIFFSKGKDIVEFHENSRQFSWNTELPSYYKDSYSKWLLANPSYNAVKIYFYYFDIKTGQMGLTDECVLTNIQKPLRILNNDSCSNSI